MIIGEQSIVEVMAGHIKKEWDATDLEWANTEKALKFCGVEVMVKPGGGGEILVGQEDYIKDVINRYGSEVKEKLIPVVKEIEKDGEDEEQDMEMVRRAQTLIARQARRAYDMGIYLLGFLKDWKLEFGAAAEGPGRMGSTCMRGA